ncbi:MAG: mechanosensitive ion channel [Chloroflexi bacterium]|nr:mechanosensitive ion channel [Chloroflexota bacterium]
MPISWVDTLFSFLRERTGLSQQLLWSVTIILLLVTLRGLVWRLLKRRPWESASLYHWRKSVDYIILAVGILWVGSIWLEGFGNFVTYLGLVSAGLAIALKDPFVNLVAWLFILTRRPFMLGDRIEVDQIKGDVVDIRFFAFTLMEVGNWVGAEQSTGRLLHIPNAVVFTQPIANYTMGFQFIWDEIPVVVTFESNWKKARDILTRIITQQAEQLTPTAKAQMQRTAESYMIAVGTLTPKVYTSVVGDGVQLTCRYLTRVRKRRGSEEMIWQEVLDAFSREADIDLAYRTQRLYFNPQEGKPGTGGPAGQSVDKMPNSS